MLIKAMSNDGDVVKTDETLNASPMGRHRSSKKPYRDTYVDPNLFIKHALNPFRSKLSKIPLVTLFVGWRLTNFIETESFWKTIFWWIFLTENLLSNFPDYNPSYYKQLYYPSYGYGKQSYNYGKLIHDFISPFHIFDCYFINLQHSVFL